MARLLCALLLLASPFTFADSLIQNPKSCFRGPFETHANWADFLAERKPKFDKEKFSHFTKDKFETFKQTQECVDFTYKVDDIIVEGFYIKPKSKKEEKLPILIYNRGGNPSHQTFFGGKVMKLAPIVSDKYILLASQYRGSSRAIKNNGKDEFGGADVNDVLKLVELAKEIPNADTSRIAMMGWSRGVMQSFLAAKQLPHLKAIIAGAGVSDNDKLLSRRPAFNKLFNALIPNFKENKDEVLKKRSVIYWAEELPKAPILLLHGDADKRVHVDQSKQLAKKLDELGHKNKLVIYENGTHGLMKYQKEFINEIHQWLAEHL